MEQKLSGSDIAGGLHFIEDDAADEDFFGTHERVAVAVASIIRTHPDLKVLGLVGPWGSGKSTVIRLIKKELKNDHDKKSRFFVFDAWLHQSDPPRRAFLERLVAFLGLSEDKYWKDTLAELNGQIDDSETTTTPTLTKAGRWILLSLLLLPIGFEFVGHDWYPIWVSIPFVTFKISVFWTGMTILFLPALVAALVYLAWRPTKSPVHLQSPKGWRWPIKLNSTFFGLANWTTHKKPNERESIISLFMNKAITRENHRTTKSPDPTTIEFQKHFRDLIKAVTSPSHRYVFVIDNLDRLPEDAALELWATIRSFFLGVQTGTPTGEQSQLPTILLPIDPQAVERIYTQMHGDEAPRLAKAFMDKTFNLTFRIPPPVFSDWRRYLTAQMSKLFGAYYEDLWAYQVGTIYERWMNSSDADATPRLINTLLNSLGVLWLQWHDEVPLATLAYFLVHKDEIDKSLGEFIREPRPDIAQFDEHWAAGIAAMYYGVPVENALQVQMERPLTAAIQQRDTRVFAKQFETPGFDFVFERVLEKSSTTPEFTANAAELLGAQTLPDTAWVHSAWRILLKRLATAPRWTAMEEHHNRGLELLLRNATKIDVERNARRIATVLSEFEPSLTETAEFTAIWPSLAQAAIDGMKSKIKTVPRIKFPGSAAGFLEVAKALEDHEDALGLIVPAVAPAEIIAALGRQLTDNEQSESVIQKFHGLQKCKSTWDWKPLVDAAQQTLQAKAVGAVEVRIALRCLGELRLMKNSGAVPALTSLSNDGFLLEKFHQAHQGKIIDEEASLLALIILTNPTFANPNNQARAQAGVALGAALINALEDRPEIADTVNKRLDEFNTRNSYTVLHEAASKNNQLMPLIRRICTKRLDQHRLGRMPVKDIIANLQTHLECFDSGKHQAFIQEISRYEKFWDELVSAPFEANSLSIFRSLLKSENAELRSEAEEKLGEKLGKVDKEQWLQALKSGGEPMGALAEYDASGKQLDHTGTLENALSETIPQLTNAPDKGTVNRWFHLSSHLTDLSQQMLYKTVRDNLLRKNADASTLEILSSGGEPLLDRGHFDDKADEVVRYLVIPLCAIDDGISWLTTQQSRVARWATAAKEETTAYLEERLKEAWTRAEEPTKHKVQDLGHGLNLGPFETEPETVVSTDDETPAEDEA